MNPYFSGAIVDGNDIAGGIVSGKPSGELFRAVASKMNTGPEDAIVFEDAVVGVQSAHDGGFGFIIAVARNNDEAALRAAGADYVLPDIGDLSVKGNAGERFYEKKSP